MEKKTRIISVANHKGGVGKTTTTASVGTVLATMGYKVLLIDMDPQSNLTSSLMCVDTDALESTVSDALVGYPTLPLPVYSSAEFSTEGHVHDSLYLVPSNLSLAGAELQLTSVMAREYILSRLLSKVSAEYDYVLIDCPPSLGLLTINALTASQYVIVPMVAEVLPFKGLEMIHNTIASVNERLNPTLQELGILITRYERSNISKDIEAKLRDSLGGLVFDTKIRKNITIAQAPLENVNIVDYDPKSNGAADYESFTRELVNKFTD